MLQYYGLQPRRRRETSEGQEEVCVLQMKIYEMEARLSKLQKEHASLQRRHAKALDELQALRVKQSKVLITGSHSEESNAAGEGSSHVCASKRLLFCAVSSQPADSGCPRELVHEASGHRLYFWTAIKSGGDDQIKFEPESVTWSHPGGSRTAWAPYSSGEPGLHRVWYSESW